jgi:hypothetical protein
VSAGWPTCASPPSAFAFVGSAGGKNFGKERYRVTRIWDTITTNKPCLS